jgi:hypothetical protein
LYPAGYLCGVVGKLLLDMATVTLETAGAENIFQAKTNYFQQPEV